MPTVSAIATKEAGKRRSGSKKSAQSPITLRCMAYSNSGSYWAECIDLNLMVRAETMDEACVKLNDAVRGYVKVAYRGESVEGLIPRPSPIANRLRYRLIALTALLFKPRSIKLFASSADQSGCFTACSAH